MAVMAAKKQRFKKPTLEPIWDVRVNSVASTNATYSQILEDLAKARALHSAKGDDVPQPTWADVVGLLNGQAWVVQLIGQLRKLLEDPAVAHAVETRKTLDEMQRKLNEVCSDLERHEANYSHERTDPYY